MSKTLSLVLSVLALLGGMAFSQSFEDTPPDGYKMVQLHVAEGLFDEADPTFTPPDGDYFQREVMGRSDAEIEERRQQAIAFFIERFGLDPEAPENQQRLFMQSFMQDPRFNQRATYVSNYLVEVGGFEVKDGGFRLIVFDPAGITLGGDFEGVLAPFATVFVFGEIVVERTVPVRFKNGTITQAMLDAMTDQELKEFKSSHAAEPWVIEYQTKRPIPFNPADETFIFIYDLYEPSLGYGRLQGAANNYKLPDGLNRSVVRSVLTWRNDAPYREE